MRADHAAARDLAVAVRLRRIVKQQFGDHQFNDRDACLEPQLWRDEIRISFFSRYYFHLFVSRPVVWNFIESLWTVSR